MLKLVQRFLKPITSNELETWLVSSSNTCSEVDNEVEKEDCIWDSVEDDPVGAQIVVEEGYGDRKDDQVSDQEDQHEQVPVEPGHNKQLVCTSAGVMGVVGDVRGGGGGSNPMQRYHIGWRL